MSRPKRALALAIAFSVLLILGWANRAESVAEPQPGLVPPPDCSAMEDPLHIGIKDPLYCAKQWEGKHGGSCVEFIQRLYGSYYSDPAFRGYAGTIQPNETEPRVGDVVLESGWRDNAHAAIIFSIEGNTLTLVESNENGDELVTFGRTIATSSPMIRGYYRFKNAP